MVKIAKHEDILRQLGLVTMEQVKAYRGDLVKDHRGRRDIFRINATDAEGRPLVLFLKRNWRPYKKDGLASCLRRGKVWSIARREWENSRALEAAGFRVAGLVAYGEELKPLWEIFSFIITEAAPGQTVEQFLRECHDRTQRRRVLGALAREIRRLHKAGLATPDLFLRHLFVDIAPSEPESGKGTAGWGEATDEPARGDARPTENRKSPPDPKFCLIDMARLDQMGSLSARRRARDLAALNVSAPLRLVSASERVRFLKVYAGRLDKPLARLVAKRMAHLLERRSLQSFFRSAAG